MVGWADTNSGQHAALFRNGNVIDLNSLVNPALGWVLQWAYGIDDAGQIVGFGTINGQTHAFILKPSGSDFNGDGNPAILWRNSLTGVNALWYMNGKTVTGCDVIDSMPDTAWQIVGVGDFNGDGKPDILWRNSSTGINAIWYMSGHTVTAFDFIDSMPDATWRIVGSK